MEEVPANPDCNLQCKLLAKCKAQTIFMQAAHASPVTHMELRRQVDELKAWFLGHCVEKSSQNRLPLWAQGVDPVS